MYAQDKLSNRSKVFTNNSVSPSRPQYIIADENSMKEKHICGAEPEFVNF